MLTFFVLMAAMVLGTTYRRWQNHWQGTDPLVFYVDDSRDKQYALWFQATTGVLWSGDRFRHH